MRVELIYYYPNEYKIYEGRLLGLMNEKQFAYLCNNVGTMTSKVRTGKSVSLAELPQADFKNSRLVISVLGNKNAQELFISRPLAEIYNCYFEKDEIDGLSFTDNNENWLTIEKI